MRNPTKREFLQFFLAMAASTSLQGCAILRRPLEGRCFGDPEISNNNSHLAIDTHVHVFNATDLPVKAFLEKVLARDIKYKKAVHALAPVLQNIGWTVAPSAKEEFDRLKVAESAIRDCSYTQVNSPSSSSDALMAQIGVDRQASYTAGRLELQRALRTTKEYRPYLRDFRRRGVSTFTEEDLVVSTIELLPVNVLEYRKDFTNRAIYSQKDVGVRGAITFILRCFQYRYVNVFDYLEGYSGNAARSIDLMVCHMVDYDWPIANGAETHTPLEEQEDVMARISALTGGRMHWFTAYDPFKQVAFDNGIERNSPLARVKQAVEEKGCIGVKLYPPMGFAPLGNADIQIASPAFWDRDTLPQALKLPDLGEQLDRSLRDLYSWCVKEDIPVMAHTNVSLGPNEDFEHLATAFHWKKALDYHSNKSAERPFAKLRVNFGHFGATDIADMPKRARAYADLMQEAAYGQNAYADSAFFAESLSEPSTVRDQLRHLLKSTSKKGRASLSNRLMYGTDWEMLVYLPWKYFDYLDNFVEIFKDLNADSSISDGGQLSDNFFGLNAARFLGLNRKDSSRNRLDTFYRRNGVAQPMWVTKLDRQESALVSRSD